MEIIEEDEKLVYLTKRDFHVIEMALKCFIESEESRAFEESLYEKYPDFEKSDDNDYPDDVDYKSNTDEGEYAEDLLAKIRADCVVEPAR